MTKCAIQGCEQLVKRQRGSTRGWCPTHSMRFYRHGDPQAWKPIGHKPNNGRPLIPIGPLDDYLDRLSLARQRRYRTQAHESVYWPLTKSQERSLLRARKQGGLTIWTADNLACALGLHPVEIWADWYELSEEKAG